MDKEKIEKFDKEQLELLLNDLQDIDKFTGFKNGAFKYELGKYQASLLVNCIKKQKEIIDKTKIFLENEGQKQYNIHDNYRGKWYSPDELDILFKILEDKEV